MTRKETLQLLTDEELETEFITARLRLLEIDEERTNRLRRSERVATRNREKSEPEDLGVWDYGNKNKLRIGDQVFLRTKSGATTGFAGITKAIVFGLDNRGFVKIHEIGNPSNSTTRKPSNTIKKKR